MTTPVVEARPFPPLSKKKPKVVTPPPGPIVVEAPGELFDTVIVRVDTSLLPRDVSFSGTWIEGQNVVILDISPNAALNLIRIDFGANLRYGQAGRTYVITTNGGKANFYYSDAGGFEGA